MNKYRNFLFAPECECGNKCTLLIRSKEELYNYMEDMLIENGCPDGAIFAISYDNHMYVGMADFPIDMFLSEEEIEELIEDGEITQDEIDIQNENIIQFISNEDIDMDFFADTDGDFRFCCYGLMIETAPGKWKIIED